MAAKKGVPNPNAGRKKGVQNKATLEFKEAVNSLLFIAAPNFAKWLNRVAEEDPGKALDICGRLAEYAYPKLGRTELTGKDGEALQMTPTLNLTIGKNGD